jgi:hypothetical protein
MMMAMMIMMMMMILEWETEGTRKKGRHKKKDGWINR